jgi:hypothetical protein
MDNTMMVEHKTKLEHGTEHAANRDSDETR